MVAGRRDGCPTALASNYDGQGALLKKTEQTAAGDVTTAYVAYLRAGWVLAPLAEPLTAPV